MWNTLESSMESIKSQYSEDNYFIRSGVSFQEAQKACDDIFLSEQSFAERKSRAMAYILENCPVEVCPEDIFADKLQNYGIIQKRLNESVSVMKKSVNSDISDAENLVKSGSIEPSTDFGHLAPNWKFVIENGIPGIISRLESYRKNSDNKEFYDNSLRVYMAIIKFMEKLAKQARSIGSVKMRFLSDNLIALAKHAPKTLCQAMQLTFIIYAIQTKLELSIVRSLGGLDRLYAGYYFNDLNDGSFTESQLREIIRYFYYRISVMNMTANMPFYICGRDLDGNDATNSFTYVLVEEYAKLDIYDPKIHVMYHHDIDKGIVRKITELIKNGKNSFVFVNVDIASEALRNIGISDEDSKKVIVYGCYETASEGEEIPSTCAGLINMPKILDMFLHCGTDNIGKICTEYKPIANYKDYNEFEMEFYRYLKHCITVCMDVITEYEKHYSELFTAPVFSGTLESCVAKGIDAFSGGAKYNNTSIVCACLASVTDSLIAVKRLVFDDKMITLDELRDILRSDWCGSEDIYNKCRYTCPKFANNNDEVDKIAASLCEFLASNVINGYKNGRGGIFRFGTFSIDWRFRFGNKTGALPDGHIKGEPLSKNMSATVGNDKNGVTSFLNSVLKIDASKIPDGCVADVILHKSAALGEEGTDAIIGLVTSFMDRRGFAIQFNVISSEVLKKAQITPDKYKNLQVRVCGWNARFVNLSKKEQDEFIIQAEI